VVVLDPREPALFLTLSGRPFTRNVLGNRVRRLVGEAGFAGYGACHLFRHTMATLMLEGGADVRYIQEILGHADLSSTEIYTHVSIHKLKAVHTETHPGAKLRRKREEDSNEDEDENSNRS